MASGIGHSQAALSAIYQDALALQDEMTQVDLMFPNQFLVNSGEHLIEQAKNESFVEEHTRKFRELVSRVESFVITNPVGANAVFDVLLNVYNHLESERSSSDLSGSLIEFHEEQAEKKRASGVAARRRPLEAVVEGPSSRLTSTSTSRSVSSSSSSGPSGSTPEKTVSLADFYQAYFAPHIAEWDKAGGDPNPFWKGREAKIINTMAVLSKIPEENQALRMQVISAHQRELGAGVTVQQHETAIHAGVDQAAVHEMQSLWVSLAPRLNSDPFNNFKVQINYLSALINKKCSLKDPSAKRAVEAMIDKTAEELRHAIAVVRTEDRKTRKIHKRNLTEINQFKNALYNSKADVDSVFGKVSRDSKIIILSHLIDNGVPFEAGVLSRLIDSTPFSRWPCTRENIFKAFETITANYHVGKRAQWMTDTLNGVLLQGDGVLALMNATMMPRSESEARASYVALRLVGDREEKSSSSSHSGAASLSSSPSVSSSSSSSSSSSYSAPVLSAPLSVGVLKAIEGLKGLSSRSGEAFVDSFLGLEELHFQLTPSEYYEIHQRALVHFYSILKVEMPGEIVADDAFLFNSSLKAVRDRALARTILEVTLSGMLDAIAKKDMDALSKLMQQLDAFTLDPKDFSGNIRDTLRYKIYLAYKEKKLADVNPDDGKYKGNFGGAAFGFKGTDHDAYKLKVIGDLLAGLKTRWKM